jgi:hypothetical protein
MKAWLSASLIKAGLPGAIVNPHQVRKFAGWPRRTRSTRR